MELTKCQENAYNSFKDRLDGKHNKHLVINGEGGTGKTYLAKKIIKLAEERGLRGIILSAPTHQSRKILTEQSGYEASTIHSILKISPTTYEDVQIFEQCKIPDLSECDLLICDEVSMYDDDLFDILMKTIKSHTIIIGLGDKEQFEPVRGESVSYNKNTISKFFTDERFIQLELVENKRNGGALLEVCRSVRNGNTITHNIKDRSGVYIVDSLNTFLKMYFVFVKTPEDLFENRIVSYSNKIVDDLNKVARKHLYGDGKDPIIKGEYLVLQEPVVKKFKYNRKTYSETVYNNGEDVRVERVTKVRETLKSRNFSDLEVDFYRIDVVSLETSVRYNLCVITDENEDIKVASYLNDLSNFYRNNKYKSHWADFWKNKGMFTKVKALPACTIHKSQGSTFKRVFYVRAGLPNEPRVIKQSNYVAISRAKELAVVY